MESIETRANQFIDEWEHYLFPDKYLKCKDTIEKFLIEIDELLALESNSKKNKAKLYYLRGRLLDFLPAYEKTAEEYLNKSIKLNPADGDCWNCLAHVLYKKKDYEGAQKAVEMAIDSKGKNKTSLLYQSVLLRNQGSSYEEKCKNTEQSVKLMKSALMMDMKDPATWFFLGNAYINNFFVNFKKVQELENAIKAYNEAEKYYRHKYPDLFFNRANAESHFEDYEKAIEDFKVAGSIDPGLQADNHISSLRKRLDYIKSCFERAVDLPKAKIEELIKTIPNSIKGSNSGGQNIPIVPLQGLSEKSRYNPNVIVSVKIMNKLTMDGDIPESFLAIDSSGKFLAVSIYNTDSKMLNQKISKDALLQIRDPELKSVKFEGFQYRSIQVFELVKVWINGVRLTKNQFVPNLIVNTSVEKKEDL